MGREIAKQGNYDPVDDREFRVLFQNIGKIHLTSNDLIEWFEEIGLPRFTANIRYTPLGIVCGIDELHIFDKIMSYPVAKIGGGEISITKFDGISRMIVDDVIRHLQRTKNH